MEQQEWFWKNFRLGTELNISGTFIYNGLYFFDQMEHFYYETEIFEFLYNISVGIERLEKIAIILLEHKNISDQETFERDLITHNHLELFNRIKKQTDLKFGKTHTKFLQLISNFYKSMRYNRFNLSSVYTQNKEKEFIKFLEDELKIEIKTDMIFSTPNDLKIKKFVGKTVGKIATQLYEIVYNESYNDKLYTHEIPFASKAYKIFMLKDFTFENEKLLHKEILIYLLNNRDSGSNFFEYIKTIKPLEIDYTPNELANCLINNYGTLDLLDHLEALYDNEYENNKEKQKRIEEISIIGDIFDDYEEDNNDTNFEL